MALQYRCDICGETKEPGDTYGPGVITEEKAGRPYVWYQEIAGGLRKLGISVQPFCEGTDNQVCGECVGDALKEMVGELWPEPIKGPIATFEDKLALAARNPEVVKVNDALNEIIEHGNGAAAEHLRQAEAHIKHVEENYAHPNGADREDRHLRSVRPIEPVPDPGPAEWPLPVPTNCPDCGQILPNHQSWCND